MAQGSPSNRWTERQAAELWMDFTKRLKCSVITGSDFKLIKKNSARGLCGFSGCTQALWEMAEWEASRIHLISASGTHCGIITQRFVFLWRKTSLTCTGEWTSNQETFNKHFESIKVALLIDTDIFILTSQVIKKNCVNVCYANPVRQFGSVDWVHLLLLPKSNLIHTFRYKSKGR